MLREAAAECHTARYTDKEEAMALSLPDTFRLARNLFNLNTSDSLESLRYMLDQNVTLTSIHQGNSRQGPDNVIAYLANRGPLGGDVNNLTFNITGVNGTVTGPATWGENGDHITLNFGFKRDSSGRWLITQLAAPISQPFQQQNGSGSNGNNE